MRRSNKQPRGKPRGIPICRAELARLSLPKAAEQARLYKVNIAASGGEWTRRDSIRVNKQWRLIFRWDGGKGEASDVYLDDHSHN